MQAGIGADIYHTYAHLMHITHTHTHTQHYSLGKCEFEECVEGGLSISVRNVLNLNELQLIISRVG